MVRLEADEFDIRRFIKSLTIVDSFSAKLKWLHREHIKFMQRNPDWRNPGASSSRIPSFGQWLASGRERKPWRPSPYTDNCEAPEDAVNALEQETGDRAHEGFMAMSNPDDLRETEFTLGFRVRKSKPGEVRVTGLYWWVPEYKVLTRDEEWKKWPHVWFARKLLPTGVRVPFNCREDRFRQALADTVQEMGGLEWVDNGPFVPKKPFQDTLKRHYQDLGS